MLVKDNQKNGNTKSYVEVLENGVYIFNSFHNTFYIKAGDQVFRLLLLETQKEERQFSKGGLT